MEHFGHKIRTIRTNKGIGLNHLASRLNVSPAYLSNLETGKTETVHLSFLKNLHYELNLPLDFFDGSNKLEVNQFSEFDFRIERAKHLLRQLNQNEPKVANYLLSVIEQGLDLYSKNEDTISTTFQDSDYH